MLCKEAKKLASTVNYYVVHNFIFNILDWLCCLCNNLCTSKINSCHECISFLSFQYFFRILMNIFHFWILFKEMSFAMKIHIFMHISDPMLNFNYIAYSKEVKIKRKKIVSLNIRVNSENE